MAEQEAINLDPAKALENFLKKPRVNVEIGDELLLKAKVVNLDSNPHGSPAILVRIGDKKIWIHFRYQEVIIRKVEQ